MRQKKKLGLSTIYVITDTSSDPEWNGEKGYVTAEMLQKHVPDYMDRMFYLSGPNTMVEAYKTLIKKMGVHRKKIVTDYFPGFV